MAEMGTEGVGDYQSEFAESTAVRPEQLALVDGDGGKVIQMEDKFIIEMLQSVCKLYSLPHYHRVLEAALDDISTEQNEDEKKQRLKDLLAEVVLNYHINESLKLAVEKAEKEKQAKTE